jgi:uncharacterized membrane protein
MSAAAVALKSPQLKLAAGGWIFFVAENALLSENRTVLIEHLGDENYHLLYGTCSTAATAAIGYGYFKIQRLVSKNPSGAMLVSPIHRLVSWGFLSVGLILASQALPKMQIPFMIGGTSDGGGGQKLQVRCPFDFTDQKNALESRQIRGMERVTRHAGLWSFGLLGLGCAAVQTQPALQVWWTGPALVAWLGGMHSDSRFRRGMGGTLDPWYDSQTSNFPFAAMLSGKQGAPGRALASVVDETKLLNAACAVGAATLWVLSRGRVR